jgi:hypothetical protein
MAMDQFIISIDFIEVDRIAAGTVVQLSHCIAIA